MTEWAQMGNTYASGSPTAAGGVGKESQAFASNLCTKLCAAISEPEQAVARPTGRAR